MELPCHPAGLHKKQSAGLRRWKPMHMVRDAGYHVARNLVRYNIIVIDLSTVFTAIIAPEPNI